MFEKKSKGITKSKEDKILLTISSLRSSNPLGIGIKEISILKGFKPQEIKKVAKKYGGRIVFGRNIVTRSLSTDKFTLACRAARLREEKREQEKEKRRQQKQAVKSTKQKQGARKNEKS